MDNPYILLSMSIAMAIGWKWQLPEGEASSRRSLRRMTRILFKWRKTWSQGRFQSENGIILCENGIYGNCLVLLTLWKKMFVGGVDVG